MPETDLVKIIQMSLEKMNKDECDLSKLYYSKVQDDIRPLAIKSKYLERPFAYEFYHALRSLMENCEINLGGRIIQAEVDKSYQHYFAKGVIPDFIIHKPNNTKRNFAAIELKLATNLYELEDDFRKLENFKTCLNYEHAVEIIIGDTDKIKRATEKIKELTMQDGEEIAIVLFNTDSWVSDYFTIKYRKSFTIKNLGAV
jgi:hypothetical protein